MISDMTSPFCCRQRKSLETSLRRWYFPFMFSCNSSQVILWKNVKCPGDSLDEREGRLKVEKPDQEKPLPDRSWGISLFSSHFSPFPFSNFQKEEWLLLRIRGPSLMFSKHPVPRSLPQSITPMIVIKSRLRSKRAIDARFCSRSFECFHSAKYSTFVHLSNEHNSIFHQNMETSAKCNHRKDLNYWAVTAVTSSVLSFRKGNVALLEKYFL